MVLLSSNTTFSLSIFVTNVLSIVYAWVGEKTIIIIVQSHRVHHPLFS